MFNFVVGDVVCLGFTFDPYSYINDVRRLANAMMNGVMRLELPQIAQIVNGNINIRLYDPDSFTPPQEQEEEENGKRVIKIHLGCIIFALMLSCWTLIGG